MPSTNIQNEPKVFDLELRTLTFAKAAIHFCRSLPKDTINHELIQQLVRSSCSVGANYREVNDALGQKDFLHRAKTSRKEAKETIYWLELVAEANPSHVSQAKDLIRESTELRNILSAIINKFES